MGVVFQQNGQQHLILQYELLPPRALSAVTISPVAAFTNGDP